MTWNNYGSKRKYHNKKVEADGLTFDSKKEYKRWQELKMLEKSGYIKNLERQVKFELIPSQKIQVRGKNKTVERPVNYIADFVYYENGKKVVEDTKGLKTREYIIKRKLMLFVHDIKIHEV